MTYLVGWGLMAFSLLLTWHVRTWAKLFAFVSFGFLAAIAILRGAVGTDTAGIYEPMARALADSEVGWRLVEPGFRFLLQGLVTVTGSEVWAVRAVTALFCAGLLLYLQRANRNELIFLIAFFLPAFFFQYGMNTLRLGLATVLVLHAFQAERRGERVGTFAFAVAAMLIHYSVAFTLLFVWIASTSNLLRPTRLLLGTAVLASIATFVILNDAYVVSKLDLYHSYASPGPFSGLSKVAVIGVVLLGPWTTRAARATRLRFTLLGALFLVAFWAVGSVSYAGLRMLDLLALALPLAVLRAHYIRRSTFGTPTLAALAVAGMVAAAFVYRNFLTEAALLSGSTSPFLPYHTLFERGW